MVLGIKSIIGHGIELIHTEMLCQLPGQIHDEVLWSIAKESFRQLLVQLQSQLGALMTADIHIQLSLMVPQPEIYMVYNPLLHGNKQGHSTFPHLASPEQHAHLQLFLLSTIAIGNLQ